MLSGTPPAVADVSVGSTEWTSAFVDYLEQEDLGDGGYSIPVGSSSQLATLPWNNLDQIRITFSEDVDVDSYDLSLSGINVTAYAFSDFSYDSQNHVAVWTTEEYIQKDALLVDLDADGIDPVQDADTNVLDGEWTDETSTFNSGDGSAGGDFEFRFNIVPGDVNHSGMVTLYDYVKILSKAGLDTEDAGYDPIKDLDGSGNIDSVDSSYAYDNQGDKLPIGNPTGTIGDAPTSAGFSDVEVQENAQDVVLSLFDAFDDQEDADSELTYEVISNSNSNLFDGTTVDAVLGELTLDFAIDANGTAELVVRATDSDGLFIDVPLVVDVEPANSAPVISNFDWYVDVTGLIVFTGTVTDADSDPTGWTVYFGGVIDGETATVVEDGTFTLIVELDPSVWGDASAQVFDDGGLGSNVAVVPFQIT